MLPVTVRGEVEEEWGNGRMRERGGEKGDEIKSVGSGRIRRRRKREGMRERKRKIMRRGMKS